MQYSRLARVALLFAGLAVGGGARAQDAQLCVVCYGCGQYWGAADQMFGHAPTGVKPYGVTGASPGEAIAQHVAAKKQDGSYCSYDVTLDGSSYPIHLWTGGPLFGHIYGATESFSRKWGDGTCGNVQRYPYDYAKAPDGLMAYNTAICRLPPGPSITLAGPTETKPRGTSGWRELMLTATVTQGGAPAPGKAVTFKLIPKAAPDGHQHGNLATKPAGSVANGSTDATGVYKVAYFPSEFAGIYTVEASCDGCGEPARMDVTVRVPGLVELTASTRRPPAYTLIGQTATHPRSHYFSVAGLHAFFSLVGTMRSMDWTNPGVNDASLVWGGRFDITGRWSGSHAGHRDGDELDISFSRPAGVSQDIRNKTYDKLAEARQFTTPQVLWHLNDNPDTGSSAHFHIYLLGQKVSAKTQY